MGEALITRRGGAGGAVGYRYTKSETIINKQYINFSKDCILLCLFATNSSVGTTWIRYKNSAGSTKDYKPKVLSLSTLYYYEDTYSRYYYSLVPIRVKFANGVYTLTHMETGKVLVSDVTPGSLFFFRDSPIALSIIDL